MAVVTARADVRGRASIATDRREHALVAAVILGAIAVRISGLGLPIIEWHGWRQTWTAYTALLFHQQGIALFHPQLPIFGPPFEAPMEFPLFQALAALAMDAGVTPDLAMRLTGLATFVLAAYLLWVLARRYAGSIAALVSLVVFLFVPLNLLFGKASLPEYLAIVGAIAWLLFGLRWREGGTWRSYGLAFVAGTLGMLVKPTTPVFWTAALVLAPLPGEGMELRRWVRARLDLRLIALCVLPVAIAYAWTVYADGVKSASIASAFLSSASDSTRHFYYSDLSERLDAGIWSRNWLWISRLVVGLGLLPFALIGLWAAWRSPRRMLWLGIVLSAVLPVAVFFGGYFRHDYYWIALTPQASLLTGAGVGWLWRHVRTVPTRAGGVVTVGLAAVITLQGGADWWQRAFPPLDDYERVLPRATELASFSDPGDLAVVVGRGFDPDLLYYARRKGLMITAENASPALYATLPSQPYRVFFSWDPAHDALDIMKWWVWNGAVGAHTYEIGADAFALRRSVILSTDDLAAVDVAAQRGREASARGLSVPCDGRAMNVPVDASGTWLVADAPTGTTVSLDLLEGPLPIRRVFVLTPQVMYGRSSIAASCDGPGSLTIQRVVIAPPPTR